LLIGVIAICTLLTIFVPRLRQWHRQSQQTQCRNNLRQIGLALHNYRDVNKKFPWATTYASDGSPMHSWRVRLGIYLESTPFFTGYDYHERWNGPANGSLAEAQRCPTFYRCPSATASQDQRCTNYVMLIDDRPGKPNAPPNRPGSVSPTPADPSAVMVIEIADSDILWMEPRDVLLSELSMKINDRSKRSLSSYHGGACVVHADGSVEILDETTTEERVRELLAK
jgi:type II secretory pathway pseudopilin PulG